MQQDPPLSSSKAPVLILGPAHSGKSEFAIRLFKPDQPAVVIGTSSLKERAFAARIDRLQSLRPAAWESIDLVSDLPATVDQAATRAFTQLIFLL